MIYYRGVDFYETPRELAKNTGQRVLFNPGGRFVYIIVGKWENVPLNIYGESQPGSDVYGIKMRARAIQYLAQCEKYHVDSRQDWRWFTELARQVLDMDTTPAQVYAAQNCHTGIYTGSAMVDGYPKLAVFAIDTGKDMMHPAR